MPGPLRFVTATSLFDGHDASINIIRRLLQDRGAEVVHLGHNRTAKEVVEACVQEDAHAVAISSYQGGHMEYFLYVRQLLDEMGAREVRIFGGGGGVITPSEREALHKGGVTRIYSPEDGAHLGLGGMVDDMISRSTYSTLEGFAFSSVWGHREIGKAITLIEQTGARPVGGPQARSVPVLGITGTGGAGKSSLIDELLLRFGHSTGAKVALLSIDPTKKRTQGALLGDRIRLGSLEGGPFYVRSLATRGSRTELCPHLEEILNFLKTQDFSLIIVETSGIGQAGDEITRLADQCLYVMTPEYGAQTQLEKIEMLESANFIALNKFERPRSEDALRDIRKQYRRNHGLFGDPPDEQLPVYGTMAFRFNDPGCNALFEDLARAVGIELEGRVGPGHKAGPKHRPLIPPERSLYLREVAKVVRDYNSETQAKARELAIYEGLSLAGQQDRARELRKKIGEEVFEQLQELEDFSSASYRSLSRLKISTVATPSYRSLADRYVFLRNENLPGQFPYGAGIFPSKKKGGEGPKRMFAGEGGPKRTNKRFHFLCQDDRYKRLSTAFDSVTLYGEDPDQRPDIFGKIGEAGVSIATLDDMKDLFEGFDLSSPETSVSMTINGPAPTMLALFMNAAMAQHPDKQDGGVEVMRAVRGTVQADILKEDQAQNTCIFSLEFSLRLMGDVQEYFVRNAIKNYYTVSISGYHIAEAGANPITQLAFTLANGLTYVEYYKGRGLDLDQFCQNFSFFFSNGLDPEYAVMGRVARKIWAVAMRDYYGADPKAQKFKYHIQTSGRSLHAQEISFNDIRTTLQAFLAICDRCNSLHTNAYDEAITTPTEESVRRAMAIQMIINQEFGLNKSDNPLQGSFLINELSQLVEEAVLLEFERLSDRGGVLGAMEGMYQRGKIQEESLFYESRKDSGELPIIGVNTYLPEEEGPQEEIELSRCTDEEKEDQILRLREFQQRNRDHCEVALRKLKEVALSGGNIFEELLSTVKYCSVGQITHLLYKVGGKYRRNI